MLLYYSKIVVYYLLVLPIKAMLTKCSDIGNLIFKSSLRIIFKMIEYIVI